MYKNIGSIAIEKQKKKRARLKKNGRTGWKNVLRKKFKHTHSLYTFNILHNAPTDQLTAIDLRTVFEISRHRFNLSGSFLYTGKFSCASSTLKLPKSPYTKALIRRYAFSLSSRIFIRNELHECKFYRAGASAMFTSVNWILFRAFEPIYFCDLLTYRLGFRNHNACKNYFPLDYRLNDSSNS